ncbi:conserved domain protein [Parvimonas sp. oral taxon 393 str. F0440]|nr:conserved domain protein [Parvimonas sp. oral taxon 393 str. F0440]
MKNDLVGYLIALSWWLAFFTSMMSAGISERGIIHPWQLVAKLYRWDRIRSFSIENKGKTIMINFKIFRDLRQEYDKSDLDKIKKIAKKNKLI